MITVKRLIKEAEKICRKKKTSVFFMIPSGKYKEDVEIKEKFHMPNWNEK